MTAPTQPPTSAQETTAAAPALGETTGRVLNELQARYPLVARPYAEVGSRLDLTEDEVLDRLREARAAGIVRQTCGIYDTTALGYSSALVAMRVPEQRLEFAAQVINAHPGVSHNYRRNHEFNLWFTVAMPPGADLDSVIARLHELAGAESTRPMPTLKLFKIGVTLDMVGDRDAAARGTPGYTEERRDEAARHVLTADDIDFIKATQGDLADVAEPFAAVAESLGTSVDAVLAHAERLQEQGYLRRFATMLNHRAAGFRANGMAVWDVPAEGIEPFGSFVAGYRNVSHCYQRPTYPDWPYNVFSMIHASRADGVEEVAEAIAAATGIASYRVLYSSVEYKKIRLPYFIPEYEQWEQICEAAAREGVPE